MCLSRLVLAATVLASAAFVSAAPEAAGAQAQAQAQVTLRIAVPAPKGSTWARRHEKAVLDLDRATGGRVVIELVLDGKAGDDAEMVKRLAAGKLDGASLGPAGLALLLPDARVFGVPGLFANRAEMRALRAALTPQLAFDLAQRGYVLGAWRDDGPVHLFGVGALETTADVRATRMWVDPADRAFQVFFQDLGVTTTALPPHQVFAAFQSGSIDAVYATPFAALASEWSQRPAHMSDQPVAFAVGGTVFRAGALAKLSAPDRRAFDAAMLALATDLDQLTTSLHAKVRKAMQQKPGFSLDVAAPGLTRDLDAAAQATWIALTRPGVGRFSAALVRALLAARSGAAMPAPQATTGSPVLPAPPPPGPVTPRAPPAPMASPVLQAKLPDLADDARALRLAIDSCDVEAFAWWIDFPIAIAGTPYRSPDALARACKQGALPAPPARALEAALGEPHVGTADVTIRLPSPGGPQTWHFVWTAQTWTLVAID